MTVVGHRNLKTGEKTIEPSIKVQNNEDENENYIL